MSAPAARAILGAALAGPGVLALTGVLDHELRPASAVVLLAAGGALLATSGGAPPVRVARPAVVAGLGALLVLGVGAYNAARHSALAPPEVALLLYGLALLAVAPRMGAAAARAVAWSFPLVLAPLALWSVQAVLDAGGAPSPLRWYVQTLVLPPLAATLAGGGAGVRLRGDTLALPTADGTLFLTVGAVCAGLYAMILFLGILALHAWERETPPGRLAALLVTGLAVLHVANLARLVVVAQAGSRWGPSALGLAHTHAGWILFLLTTLGFWWVALGRASAPAPRESR